MTPLKWLADMDKQSARRLIFAALCFFWLCFFWLGVYHLINWGAQ
jgi:hypothetical protein